MFYFVWAGERLGRGIVTDAITTPVVNTSAYFFQKTSDLIDFKVFCIVKFLSCELNFDVLSTFDIAPGVPPNL